MAAVIKIAREEKDHQQFHPISGSCSAKAPHVLSARADRPLNNKQSSAVVAESDNNRLQPPVK